MLDSSLKHYWHFIDSEAVELHALLVDDNSEGLYRIQSVINAQDLSCDPRVIDDSDHAMDYANKVVRGALPMLQNIKSIVNHRLRHIHQTKDKNFIGFDKYQKHGAYHWKELTHSEIYRRKLDAVADFVRDEYTCLDIGCGDGAYVYILSDKCKNIIGIDADYDAIRHADSKMKEKAVTNCRCMQIPISKITLKNLKVDSQFDLVYSMDVIEHLPDPDELLQIAVSIVKPRGLVLIGTPIFLSAELVSPYHVKEFSVQEMRDMLSPYFCIKQEIVLPMLRADGKIYEDGFYISVGTPTPESEI